MKASTRIWRWTQTPLHAINWLTGSAIGRTPCYTDTLLPCLHAAEEKPLPQSFPGTENESESFHLHNTTKLGCLHPHLDEHFFFGAAQEVHWTWWKFGRSPEPTTSYQRPSLTPRNHFISFVVGWCFGAVQKCLDCYYSCPTGTWPNRLVILIWSMLGNASIHLFEPADQKWRN